jgi:hypothetical protein
MEDNLNYFQMEDNLDILVSGRQPQLVFKWKMTLIFLLNSINNLKEINLAQNNEIKTIVVEIKWLKTAIVF